MRESKQCISVDSTTLFLYCAFIVNPNLVWQLNLDIGSRWNITGGNDSELVCDGELANTQLKWRDFKRLNETRIEVLICECPVTDVKLAAIR